MKMFADLGLQDIEVRYIPASDAYDYFLTGKLMDINKLKL